jgi:hypothetical protein
MKAALILVASLLSIQADRYAMVWRPKTGQVLNYSMKFEGKMLESPFSIAADVKLHVKKVEPNGDYTMGTSFKNMVTTFGGQTETNADPPEEVQKFNAKGDLLDKTPPTDQSEDDAVGEIITRASDIPSPDKPVAIHEKWTHEFPEVKALGLPKGTGTYEILEKSGSKLKVSVTYQEASGLDPTTAIGTSLVDASDFTPLSLESSIKNLRMSEGVPPATAKLTMKLKA